MSSIVRPLIGNYAPGTKTRYCHFYGCAPVARIAQANALAHPLPGWLMTTTRPSVELLLAELAACQTEDAVIVWAAKVKDPGLPELYAAMLDKIADLRETAANQNRPPKD
jgi:hypothetical protein